MKLIFNSSMPRSGSELLQVVLHQNPEVYASPTSPLLGYQVGARASFELPEVRSQPRDMMRQAFTDLCRGMADGYYLNITDRPVVCDKNRGWMYYWEWVSEWNPEPKMICMVRDLRSILASMERIFRANRHSPSGPDDPSKLRNLTTEDRVRHWLNSQPVGQALNRTLDIFQRGLDSKILFIRYEDFCNDPASSMSRIYEYTGIEPFDHDFANIEKKVEEDDIHFGIFGRHTVLKEIRPHAPGDWAKELSGPLCKAIRDSVPWYFETFHY